MLVYFFSDRNYNRAGFHAEFTTNSCPFNCNGNGKCNDETHACSCKRHFIGDYCQHVSDYEPSYNVICCTDCDYALLSCSKCFNTFTVANSILTCIFELIKKHKFDALL